jgi:CMP-N-acetylneuraminic acid synthetase
MILGRRILVVVPARGGSKGIKLKNLRPFQGIALVARVGMLLRNIRGVDLSVVSTDHPKIAALALQSGIHLHIKRPPRLSGDHIGDWQVLVHALLKVEYLTGKQFDVVVMLQPTSPLRTSDQVIKTIKKLIKKSLDSVWTVSQAPLKYHPLKSLVVDLGNLRFFDQKGKKIMARQQLQHSFIRNGIAYAFTRDCLLKQKTTLGKRSDALVIRGRIINIDTLEDLKNKSEA